MIASSMQDRISNSIQGWQQKIQGTMVAVSGTPVQGDVSGKPASANLVQTPAAALATGTYYFFIPCSGCGSVDVTLRTSANTGTGLSTAATVYKTLVDNITEKMNAAGTTAAGTFATFVNGTQQTVSITNLRGEHGVVLKLVVPATSTVTFDQGEFSAL